MMSRRARTPSLLALTLTFPPLALGALAVLSGSPEAHARGGPGWIGEPTEEVPLRCSGQVAVRAAPEDGARILERIRCRGAAPLAVLGEEAGWYRVALDHAIGFVDVLDAEPGTSGADRARACARDSARHQGHVLAARFLQMMATGVLETREVIDRDGLRDRDDPELQEQIAQHDRELALLEAWHGEVQASGAVSWWAERCPPPRGGDRGGLLPRDVARACAGLRSPSLWCWEAAQNRFVAGVGGEDPALGLFEERDRRCDRLKERVTRTHQRAKRPSSPAPEVVTEELEALAQRAAAADPADRSELYREFVAVSERMFVAEIERTSGFGTEAVEGWLLQRTADWDRCHRVGVLEVSPGGDKARVSFSAPEPRLYRDELIWCRDEAVALAEAGRSDRRRDDRWRRRCMPAKDGRFRIDRGDLREVCGGQKDRFCTRYTR